MSNLKIELSIDAEIVEEFREGFSDHYDIISHCVMELEKNPDNREFLDEIFRSLHTIKGNANMCQLDELTQFAHALEDVVSAMRAGTLAFSKLMGEVILITLDEIKEVSEDIFDGRALDFDRIHSIESILHQMETAPQAEIPAYASALATLITGHDIDSDVISGAHVEAKENLVPGNTHKPVSSDVLQDTLNYFCHLASLMDKKLPYWKNRIQRTLSLSQAMNHAIGTLVDPQQLEAAIYMHDIAFAFLSDSLLLANSKYSDEELQQIRIHPRLGSDLVRLIPGWDDAAQIVWQHHERWDGNGYPRGLKSDDICIGAQIVAIVDAFESMTHPRPDRQYKRSVLRAVTEINNCSGTQFSPELTKVFNDIVRQMLASKHKTGQ